MNLAFDRAGDGDRLIVLLHGLGATRHVWQPMREAKNWRGGWLAPDLRGHGASPHATGYSLGQHAADVADMVMETGPWREIIVVGHSMGGAVALTLASGWFGIQPLRVFGLGIKVAWTGEERARMAEMAATPSRVFPTEAEAIARYLKISGLAGMIAEDSDAARSGVARAGTAWRLAADPKTAAVGAPPMQRLIAAAQCPIHLARGETDRMMTHEQLQLYDRGAADLMGLGHNAMVESPATVWDWIEGRLA